jgi:hypothetical protein
MNGPRPPHLRTIRTMLAVVHLAGVAGLILPWLILPGFWMFGPSPMSAVEFIWSMIGERHNIGTWIEALMWFGWLAQGLGLFVPVLLLIVQMRACLARALGLLERRLLVVAVLISAASCLTFVGWLAIQVSTDNEGWDFWPLTTFFATATAGAAGAVALFRHNARRRIHPAALLPASLRLAYGLHVSLLLILWVWRADLRLGSGGWLCLFVAILYAVEATILLIFGRRHPSGTASHHFLQYWLPTPDADPRPDMPVCADCGYDLRGTVSAGIRLCPECGTAVASSATAARGNRP